MKKITTFIMAGVLTASSIAGGVAPAFASDYSNVDAKPATTVSTNYDEVTDFSFSISKYVENLNFLTAAEKQQLLDTEKKTAPYMEKLAALNRQIFKITEDILATGDNLFAEYKKLMNKNEALWDKLFGKLGDAEFLDTEDAQRLIKKSNKLTAAEKKVLLADYAAAKVLTAKIDKLYEKAELATAGLEKQADALLSIIEKIESADAPIWEKISTYESNN